VVLAVAGRSHRWAAWFSVVLGALGGMFFAVRSAVWLVSGQDHFAWPYLIGGAAVAAVAGIQLTRWRAAPIVLVAIQLGIGLIAYWAYNAVSGAGLNPNNYLPEDLASPLRAELPVLALGLASVGLFIGRSAPETLERLGITRPTWWQPFVALLVAITLVSATGIADNLTYLTTPSAYYAIGAVQSKTAETVLIAVIYSLLAGISEEALFRGALQPRVGLVPAAMLFAMIHIQYGVTAILLLVFAAGLMYGAMRVLFNTTTAIISHVFFDLLLIVGFNQLAYEVLVPALGAVLVVPIGRWWRDLNVDANDEEDAESRPRRPVPESTSGS
jgi:hypothetical protein